MKKFIFPLGLAAMLTVSCSDDTTTPELDDSQKTPIMLSSTDNTAKTSYSFDGNTRAGFTTANTSIVMRMVATDGSNYKSTKVTANASIDRNPTVGMYSDVNLDNQRYWDDAFGRKTKLSIYAVAIPNKKDVIAASKLAGGDTWATETSGSVNNTITWTVSETQTNDIIANEDLVYSNNIQTNTAQTSPIKAYYNIKNGVYRWNFTNGAFPTFDGSDFSVLQSGEMQFAYKNSSVTDGPGKFDTGNLNFLHALSRVTLKIKADRTSGFSDPLPEFAEVKLFDMPYTGTLDLNTGLFDTNTGYTKGSGKEIYMGNVTEKDENVDKQYMAQVLPGYTINKDEDLKNVLQFKIGDNIYYISQKKVYEALDASAERDKLAKNTAGNIVMAQGQSFVLTVTVKKTGIENLTATLADWTEISGSAQRNNAYLEFSFAKHGTTDADNFNVYRLQDSGVNSITTTDPMVYNWNGGFGATGTTWENGYIGASPSENGTYNSQKVWKVDNWYWDDNKSFYHFRTVGTAIGLTDIKSETVNGSKYNFFTVKDGKNDGNYRWGAPLVTGKNLEYDKTNGFDYSNTDHHISQAIGATNSYIQFTHINMLSNIRVNVKTPDGNEHVKLYANGKGTTVKLTHIYKEGKVYMGNGLVIPTGSRTTDENKTLMNYVKTNTSGVKEDYMGADDETYALKGFYDFYVVPQELIEGDTYVGLEIQTPDDNIYFVVQKLSEITVSSRNTANPELGQKDGKITYWYPNCIYNYTITVTKTGIKAITCTLADWTVINGADQNIGLED